MQRRSFLALSGAAAISHAAPSGLRIGVTDWNLNLPGQLEAVDLAAQIGFAGVEVSLGRKPVNGKLPFSDPAMHAAHLKRARELGIEIISTCLDILHVNGLKNDKLAETWLAQAIEINRSLGVRVILLPFFGARQLETHAEMDYVADLLRNFTASAAKANVVLGLENTNSARDNLRILDRVRSSAVQVFYDTGNSFSRGHDVYREIPMLGKERICQFHLKDNPGFMGQGGLDFQRIIAEIRNIGYQGFVDLETSSPTRDIRADMIKNLKYLQSVMSL